MLLQAERSDAAVIENFIEYMWYLLTTPFKKVKKGLNEWYILCRVFGKRFDEVKEDILRARDEGMVATCSHEMLPLHGADRKFTQYAGEQPENYRSRIAMWEELYKLGGTNEGILLALRTLGYSSPELVRANDLTGFKILMLDGSWALDGSLALGCDYNSSDNRWAEFYVVIEMDAGEGHPISFDIMRKTVRQWKEVGAKDNYFFRYNLVISNTHNMRFIHALYNNYVCYWDKTKTECITRVDYSLGVHHQTEYRVIWHEEHNLIYLDGTWILDGSRIIDAWQKTEVL